MKTSDLLLSNLNITEDGYVYKGTFFLSNGEKTIEVDVADLQHNSKIVELKNFFNLEETDEKIRNTIIDMIIEKSSISSRISEGENYDEAKARRKRMERLASSLDFV
ncbi:MAG TPA: hypothetical protein GXX14_03715 [Clostridiaceae bacterium]|nr:hypothetical protein [Clostridiaceae bacterium]